MQSKKPSLCCILNYAPHYREEIYLKMEQELSCDFYFGDSIASKIKKMDYSLFKKKPIELNYVVLFSHFNWMRGAIPLAFKPYHSFLLTGEPYCLSTWVILIINRIIGKKTYLWSHGWYGNESRIKTLLKKSFFKLSNGVFLYGHYAKELMIKEGISEAKLAIIYNSLQYSKQKILRNSLIKTNSYKDHFKNDKPTAIFIGRVGFKKKIDQLIQALVLAKVQGKTQFNICIVGTGSGINEVKLLVEKLGLLNDVWFFGPCYDEEKISELIFNADVCVSPGEVGLTAIHSLSYGTPVITHHDFPNQMPEFEVVVEGNTGSFFEKDNITSLMNSLDNWFRSYSPKTEVMVNNCFKIIDERYNPLVQINTLRNTIEYSSN